ncbi:MAG: hypothetical protein VXY83_02080 [Pseudomonadota bacterium]|nr:hypothetical protein [Pseudomonadota bacterium]
MGITALSLLCCARPNVENELAQFPTKLPTSHDHDQVVSELKYKLKQQKEK